MWKSKKLRNRVASLIKRDRAWRAQQELNEGTEAYKVANKLLGKNKPDDLSQFIANEGGDSEAARRMNEHFEDKVHQFKVKLKGQATCDPLSKLTPARTRFCFQDVTITQVEKIIRKMKKSHSSGPDGITSGQLKSTINAISPVMSPGICWWHPALHQLTWSNGNHKKTGRGCQWGNWFLPSKSTVC